MIYFFLMPKVGQGIVTLSVCFRNIAGICRAEWIHLLQLRGCRLVTWQNWGATDPPGVLTTFLDGGVTGGSSGHQGTQQIPVALHLCG